MRRLTAKRTRRLNKNTWPIDINAARKPEGWPGWPEGKKFAFIITHDVEGPEGLAKCQRLAEMEMELGFRSSFNFIPEGSYRVPKELLNWLRKYGFEIGVHDLEHDGLLFKSRASFSAKAKRINSYLNEWGASGFRAGFMLRNLDWYHDLNIQYDASTFDTDPFEPNPQGAQTIFPFWVQAAPISGSHRGYVELPYTLPQDSTLFLLLRENSPDIWMRKLAWIAESAGMALVNVHPDYVRMDGELAQNRTYPLAHYRQLLEHVRRKYQQSYWQALPGKVNQYVRKHHINLTQKSVSKVAMSSSRARKTIWIDLENTPHIPFFAPIIRELERRDYNVILTARDAYQTCEMADLYRFNYRKIGQHFGQKMALKALGLGIRSAQLFPFALRERPHLALNHGSRSQVVACNILRIPSITIMDYEYSRGAWLGHPRWMIVPKTVTQGVMGTHDTTNFRHYSGIKEDVYAPDLVPDPSIMPRLGLAEGKPIIITVRPPANEAHYHNPEAEVLFEHFMERAIRLPEVRVVLLPRNKRQEAAIRSQSPHWFIDSKVVVPDHVVDGLNLVWHSDLVVSGGGTMNREAAALGVPVYSIFRGKIGAVDHQLQAEGRLTLIENTSDVDKKITIQSREKRRRPDATPRQAMTDILNHIEDIFRIECGR